MSEYTKGEWEHGEFNYPDNGEIGRCEIRQDMGILAHVYLPAKNRSGYKEGQANARLIASAPTLKQQRDDLLVACKESQKLFAFIAENYKSAPHFPTAERLVDAAIAKCEA